MNLVVGFNMSAKVKNLFTKIITYMLSLSGMTAIIVFQYIIKNSSPPVIKITIPCLLALLITFLIYYKALKAKINRKLQAVETAKEIGIKGKTSAIIANLLETIGVVIPMVLIAGIFVLGGKYLVRTGYVLFEILGMYTVIIIGNIICDFNTRQELKQKEVEQAEEFANKIVDKINKTPVRYE